jgi:DNA-binding SARP family transcriptional activator
MCKFKICVLGQFVAQFTELPPIRFVSLKEQELLSFLVLRRDRTHPRELVAAVLWGDTTVERSKKYLRNELWRLRNDTTPPDESFPLVSATKDWVRLNPEADIWCDADALESTFDFVRAKPAGCLSAQEAALLDETVQLYGGPLLNGWYQDWFQADRDRLHQMYLEIADKLMAYHEVNRFYDIGIALALQVLREEPTCERTHRRLMRLYYHTGDRASALKQFARCSSILRNTLGVTPSVETRALQQQLLIDSLDPPRHVERRQNRVDLLPILQRVDDLRRQLDDLRSQIEVEVTEANRPDQA